MKIETGWGSPPQSIGGLDHLGTQALCVLIYAQLLPGIINVTDRARYYSLYLWVIWSFDQRNQKDVEQLILSQIFIKCKAALICGHSYPAKAINCL